MNDPRSLVDYAKSLDCIHCGLCLHTCPTYQLTGAESSSPRGRIHMMRALAEGRLEPDAGFADEMQFCLLCRHCESVCPAGVRFGAMMEHTRGRLAESQPPEPLARAARWIGFRQLLPHPRRLRLLAASIRFLQRTGLWSLLARLTGERGKSLAHFPFVPAGPERSPLPPLTPARDQRAESVAILEGCVMPVLYGRVNRATVSALSSLGIECRVPTSQRCCGSLHAHNGDLEGARAFARANIESFEAARDDQGRPLRIVTNSAGCGAHMKELHHLFDAKDEQWHERARRFASRVVDFTELAAERIPHASPPPSLPPGRFPGPVTWDDPCHLCHGQSIRAEPRSILAAIHSLRTVDLPDSESCCGSAGIYSLLRPADSQALLARKIESLRATEAAALITANPGCQLQWQSGISAAQLDVPVLHIAEVLAEALGDRP